MSAGANPGGYQSVQDLPEVLPVFPLDGALLLPRGGLPLTIFEPRYLNMIDDAMAGDRVIGMISTAPGGPRDHPRLAGVGCAGRITTFAETPDGRYLITLTGLCRFERGEELPAEDPYRRVRADYARFAADLQPSPAEAPRERARLLKALRAYLEGRGLDIDWETARAAPAEALVNSLSMALPFSPPEKQALLEADDLHGRETALIALLEIEAANLDDDGEPPSIQ